MKASDHQEGGQHYKNFPIQPAEFCQRNRLNWCEANVVKYVCRHAEKKGAEDLRKAKHYIDLLLEWEYSTPLPTGEGPDPLVKDTTAESLCHTCQRNKDCVGDYPRTKDGGCEGYYGVGTGVHISEWHAKEKAKAERQTYSDCAITSCCCYSVSAVQRCGKTTPEKLENCTYYAPVGKLAQTGTPSLRERMMDAKEEAADHGQVGESCETTSCCHYSTLFMRNCQVYSSTAIVGCAEYHTRAKDTKPAPVALAICPSCDQHPGCKGTVDPAEDGSCKGFSAKEATLEPICAVKCKECVHPMCGFVGRDITFTSCANYKPKEAVSDTL